MACGVSLASNTATMTSAGVVASAGGNMSRSPITTRIRSRPSENPQAGISAEEHADQVVVASAAAEAAGKVGHVNLHDGARVVRQASREAGIERESCAPRGCLPRARRMAVTFSKARAVPADRRAASVLGLARGAHAASRRRSSSTPSLRPSLDPALASSAVTPSAPILSSLSIATSASPCTSADADDVEHRRQQLAVVQADREVGETQLRQRVGHRRAELRLDNRRRRAETSTSH